MTATLTDGRRPFVLPAGRVATGPVEASGRRRDAVRLLVARGSPTADGRPDAAVALTDALFADLPRFLHPGDVLVVNTSATLPAALPAAGGRVLHLSTELPGGLWVVELRRACGTGSGPLLDAAEGQSVTLPGGARARLLSPYPARHEGPTRLWVAVLELPLPLHAYLGDYGRPIRYGCGDDAWPLSAYQTVFAAEPGSAEMPSAARAFTPELVTSLVAGGVVLAPLTLHTGVSSQERGEPPYAERYHVPLATAELVNGAHTHGHRVVAVGTTATRALETVTDERGQAHPGSGWTDLVITAERGVRVVDGLITGWHEPEASHLQLLEAVGGRHLLERSYEHALAGGYRWHEFGDLHLILPR